MPHMGNSVNRPHEARLDHSAIIEVVARDLTEYLDLFGLKDGTLDHLIETGCSRILDLPGSVSSFGADTRQLAQSRGKEIEVVSADIIYDRSAPDLLREALETLHSLLDPYIDAEDWKGRSWIADDVPFSNPRDLLVHRERLYQRWFQDFTSSKSSANYVQVVLPDVTPLKNLKFDLILSGNLLFVYSRNMFEGDKERTFDFHRNSLRAMSSLLSRRGELRIYPVGTDESPRYERLPEILDELAKDGFMHRFVSVNRTIVKHNREALIISRR